MASGVPLSLDVTSPPRFTSPSAGKLSSPRFTSTRREAGASFLRLLLRFPFYSLYYFRASNLFEKAGDAQLVSFEGRSARLCCRGGHNGRGSP